MESEIAYRKLIVWQKAHHLVISVYDVTKHFPRHELFGLVSQLRRTAVSVAANIVEGYSRKTDKEKLNFYNISRGSLSEVEYLLDLSFDLKYIDKQTNLEIKLRREEVGRLLSGFIRSFR